MVAVQNLKGEIIQLILSQGDSYIPPPNFVCRGYKKEL
jgi:hypothetical protein